MRPSASPIHFTRNRRTKFWCPHLDHIMHTRLVWFWSRLTVKAFEIWCPNTAYAFGNEFVASLLFLVGKFQLRKAITINILSAKHKDWFGLKYELLSFPGADPPGPFEVRLFPISLLLDGGKQEAQRKCPFSACSKAVRRDPYFKFHFREANTFLMGVYESCVLSVFSVSFDVQYFLYVSSLTLVRAVLLNLQWVLWVTDKNRDVCSFKASSWEFSRAMAWCVFNWADYLPCLSHNK